MYLIYIFSVKIKTLFKSTITKNDPENLLGSILVGNIQTNCLI